MANRHSSEPVVVTGIGLVTALGADRESTWAAIRQSRCGIDFMEPRPGLPDELKVAAQVKLPVDFRCPDRLRAIRFGEMAFAEAMRDAGLNLDQMDRQRIGVSAAAHLGDLRHTFFEHGLFAGDQQFIPWFEQWFPNSLVDELAYGNGLTGPRLCYSTACASGVIAVIQAARSIRQGNCDVMIAGGAESIESLFAAGFHRMKALSDASMPRLACQPFDVGRRGFVMGEGAAFLTLERQSHAIARGATIYATILSERMASQAHHITSLDVDDQTLTYLMRETLRAAELHPEQIGYVNAHGTGTHQNDLTEINCINQVFGDAAESLHVSSTKSQIGHLVNASGCAELAVTLLGMRDGISPPTVNLHHPEASCRFNCVPNHPLPRQFQHALKFSMAFGGHLAGIAVQRFDSAEHGFTYPQQKADRAA